MFFSRNLPPKPKHVLGLVIEQLIRKRDKICAAYHAAAVSVWSARRHSLVDIAWTIAHAPREA